MRAEQAAFERDEFYADLDNALEVLAELRRAAPVYWHAPGKFWLVTKYEDLRYVGSRPELFSSRFGFQITDSYPACEMAGQLPAWAQEQLADPSLSAAQTRGLIARGKLSRAAGDADVGSLLISDPPRHGELRSFLTPSLSPRAVRPLRPRIAEVVDDVLDGIEPGSVHDFVETVAEPIPPRVVSSFLDVAPADAHHFTSFHKAFIQSLRLNDVEDPAERERLLGIVANFGRFVRLLLSRKLTAPGKDLMSVLAVAQADGEKDLTATDAEMLSFVTISGGSGTTVRLLTAVAHHLAAYPEQRALLLERPELIPAAIDEVLRFFPIVWSECRTAVERTQLGGQTIEKDDFLALMYPSANRDEDIWERPNEFDITRSFDSMHVTFGWGEHACPGRALAHLEATVVLERLLERFPNWSLAGPPVYEPGIFLNGYSRLPVRFDV